MRASSIAIRLQGPLKHFRGDLFGGLTAGIVALPLALAFGEQSGLGGAAGLYGAAFIAFFAALLGGTNTQISGPPAPMTVLSAAIVGTVVMHSEGDSAAAFPVVLAVFLLAGGFQIVLGLAGMGAYIRFIPRTVVSGFMTGIGVIILVTQVLPVVGYVPHLDAAWVDAHRVEAERILVEDAFLAAGESWLEAGSPDLGGFDLHHHMEFAEEDVIHEAQTLIKNESHGVIGSIRYFPKALANINWVEFGLGLATIALVYISKRVTTLLPSPLVALVVVSGAAVLLDLDYRRISKIDAGLPDLQLSMFSVETLSRVGPYILSAFILSLLGAIDSLLTSVVADNLTKTRHKPNRELVGQGIGNTIAAVFGGLPGAGATIRTVVNIQAGGRTRLSGMISGVVLFSTMIFLGPVASQIPVAVLAGILVTVGIGVMDYKGLRELRTMEWGDRAVLLLVLALTVFWQLVYAVAVGLVLAALQFMKYMGEWSSRRFELRTVESSEYGGTVVKYLHGPLFFGNASAISDLALEIDPEVKRVVIDLSDVHFIDQSGVAALEEVMLSLSEGGREVHFEGASGQPKLRMESVRLLPA